MTFIINAVDPTGTLASIATEDPREALQSFLAFEAADFRPVRAYDEGGAFLLKSDLVQLSNERTEQTGLNSH